MSSRGFNKGRYYRKNSWRGGYRATNTREKCISYASFCFYDTCTYYYYNRLIILRNYMIQGNKKRRPADNPTEPDGSSSSSSVHLNIDNRVLERLNISTGPVVKNLNKIVTSPYAGWKLYFPDDGILIFCRKKCITFRQYKTVNQCFFNFFTSHFCLDYKTSTAIVRKVKATEEFILNHIESFNEEDIEERRSCIFDLKDFNNPEFHAKWPSFKEDLFSEPLNTLNCLGLAIHQVEIL